MKRLALLLLLPLTAAAQVTTPTFSVTYTCTGTAGPFAFSFPISAASAMTVTENGTALASTAYTVTPVNNNFANGGSVTLNAVCTAGYPLVLTRTTPITQTSIFTDNMPIPMKTIQNGLDKLTQIDQELAAGIGTGGSGSVSSVSVATANGLTGTVTNPNTTPQIKIAADSSHVIPINTGTGQNYLNDAGGYTVPSGNPFATLTVQGSSTFKFLAGSPTATSAGSVAGAVANCLTSPCYVTVDPAYTGTDTYGSLASQTFINDLRFGQSHTTAYNWGLNGGYWDANQENCIENTLPSLTLPPSSILSFCRHQIFTSTYPGWNQGNNWYVGTGTQIDSSMYGAGIENGFLVSSFKMGTGDFNSMRSYTTYSPGFVTVNDEGVVPFAASAIENGTMFTATVSSSSVNALNQTVLTLTSPTNVKSLGVGRPVIDKTSGVVSGTQTYVSQSNGIATVSVSGFTPTTSSCGTTTAGISTPIQVINAGSSQSIPLTGLPSGLTNGMQITVAGPGGNGGGHVETTKVISAGSFSGGIQTVTANLIYDYGTGATVCGGGLQGFEEQTAYTTTGYRYLQYVVGAPTSSTLLVTSPWGSNGLISGFTKTGAIKVYQGGTLVDLRDSTATNLAMDGNQLTAMMNSAAWTPGDTVEVSDLMSGQVNVLKSLATNNSPYAPVVELFTTQTNATFSNSASINSTIAFQPSTLSTYGGALSSNIAVAATGSAPYAAGLVLANSPIGGLYTLPSTGSVPSAVVYSGPILTIPLTLTACSITSNVLTLTTANTANTSGGNSIVISGFSGGCAFLNSTSLLTTSAANSTTITIPYTHANTSATDSGTGALGPVGNSIYPYYDGNYGDNFSYNYYNRNLTANFPTITLPAMTYTTEATATACASSASPSVCGSAAAGFVAFATSGTTLVVQTTAFHAGSQVFIQADSSLGTALGITCDTSGGSYGPFKITSRTGGTSFTITNQNPDASGQVCLSYHITN